MGPKDGRGSFAIYNQRPPLSQMAAGPMLGASAGVSRSPWPEAGCPQPAAPAAGGTGL